MEDLTSNISVGGMFIQTDAPFSLGTHIRLKFRLPDIADPILAVGTVCWVNQPGAGSDQLHVGMGVHFEALSDPDAVQEMLEEWGSRQSE